MDRKKKTEESGDWKQLNNEELLNLFSMQIIIRIIQEPENGITCSTHDSYKNWIHSSIQQSLSNKKKLRRISMDYSLLSNNC